MSPINFVASIDTKYLDKLDEIVSSLKEHGFSIKKVRKFTGTISGSVDNANSIQQVDIPGLTIEEERKNYAFSN